MDEQHEANILLVCGCPRPVSEKVGLLRGVHVRQQDFAPIWLKLLSFLAWFGYYLSCVQRFLEQLLILLAVGQLLWLLNRGLKYSCIVKNVRCSNRPAQTSTAVRCNNVEVTIRSGQGISGSYLIVWARRGARAPHAPRSTTLESGVG